MIVDQVQVTSLMYVEYTCSPCPLYLPVPLHSLLSSAHPPCVALIGQGTRCRLLVRGHVVN
jgi:hypothetical protein